jgi:formylmethanofuran dehydrogenase subunit E
MRVVHYGSGRFGIVDHGTGAVQVAQRHTQQFVGVRQLDQLVLERHHHKFVQLHGVEKEQ